ncbi:hypothetical protein N0V88_008081 [Collariella sp. IMI 366227]|nr:hypothetical protein N0V88_008081 [Collariella sp. IMI 366227]
MDSRDSSPQRINGRADSRRQSILSEFLPESLPLPPSFIATSPIVREILARDIAECSSDDDPESDRQSDSESQVESEPYVADAKLAFHPNGITSGCGYSTLPIQGLDRPVPNPKEVEESLQAELSLLRDNAILPPKYPVQRSANVLSRVFRRIFSTRIKDHEAPMFEDIAVETTPLLPGGAAEAIPTPPPEEVHDRFEDAVATQSLKTTWQREAKTLIQYSIPLICAFLMHYSVTIGKPILAALVPDTETAALAAMFLRVLILGMPGVAALETGKRFVQSQGLFHVTTYALLIGAPASFLMNYIFVFKLGWGFAGAAAAMAITQNLLPVLLILYKAFNNWGQFGTAELASQSILNTLVSTSFNIPFPLAIATSTRVANLIGANLSDAARKTAKVAIAAGCLVGCFNLLTFVTLRHHIPRVFTDDERVIRITSQVILVCAVMQIFDALAAVSHGILRGVGRQAIGGYANLVSYYLVALPISLSTAFAFGWKLSGLWAGLTVGLAVVSALELTYLYNADWEIAVLEAQQRMSSENVVEDKSRPLANGE